MSTPSDPDEPDFDTVDHADEGGSDADEPENLQPWQRQKQARADRELAYNALDMARKSFERVSRKEYGDDKSLEPLGDKFDPELSNVIAQLLAAVRDVLFDDPQEVWTGRDTELRFAVEFIPTAQLRELGKTLERILIRTLERDAPEPREVTDLLPELVSSLRLPLEQVMRPGRGTAVLSSGVMSSSSTQRRFTTSEQTARRRWAEQLEQMENDFRRAIRLASAVERAEVAADETSRARDAARQAAGQTGSAALGAYFAKTARREARLASQWTAFTIAAVVAVVGVGSLIILHEGDRVWTESLAHLAIVLPIIGLASYTARIARHHRLHGLWSDTAAVQLESVPAFAEQLSPDAREQLILGMGANIFAAPPSRNDDARSEYISAIPPDLIDALKSVAERIPKPT